jgi:hypothetical protein
MSGPIVVVVIRQRGITVRVRSVPAVLANMDRQIGLRDKNLFAGRFVDYGG